MGPGIKSSARFARSPPPPRGTFKLRTARRMAGSNADLWGVLLGLQAPAVGGPFLKESVKPERLPSFTPRRPPAVFRDNVLFGCLQASTTIYRREFHFDRGETFETKWITGWAASGLSREGKMPWPSHRLAEKAAWKVDPFSEAKNDARAVDAMLLAGDWLFVAGSDGELRILSTTDGKPIARHALPAPLWDGMALAGGRLYYATREGRVLCLGKRGG